MGRSCFGPGAKSVVVTWVHHVMTLASLAIHFNHTPIQHLMIRALECRILNVLGKFWKVMRGGRKK